MTAERMPMRRWRRLAVAIVLPALVMAVCAGSHAADSHPYESPIAPEQRRGSEQTLLTYPEWFLVHSPAEYATFIATEPSHRFPFIGHVGQLWQGYAAVTREQIHEGAPANAGYHVMIIVIASSTTAEYVLRSAYENTAGRLSWALASQTLTDEDRYAAKVAQDYVDFIRREPWYLFDFRRRLIELWTTVPASGDGFVRKWERRYALTTEYAIKAVYAWLIEKATRAAYDPALLTTQVVVDRVPAEMPTQVRVVRNLDGGMAILELPRYYDFRPAATLLAQRGAMLTDIAGNDTQILVTAWTRDAVEWPHGSRVIFEQPLLTKPGTRRVAALVPVGALSRLLLDAPRQNLVIKHIYDY